MTSTNARGFSLIELLVVIGIVVVLVGVALPALHGARTAARTTESMSNLRQMAIAANTYAEQYRFFPPALRYEVDAVGALRTIAWDWVQDDAGNTSPGPLWQFSDHPDRVMQDPLYSGPSTFGQDRFTGYNYNTSYLGAEQPYGSLGWTNVRMGIPLAGVLNPHRCAIFGQGGWSGGANKFMRAPSNREHLPPAVLYAGGQAFRARGRTLVAFVDGHVDGLRAAFPGQLATDHLLATIMDHPSNGFLSDDDELYDPRHR